MPAAEDKASSDAGGVQTRDAVLTAAIAELKHALEEEQHESDAAHRRIQDLQDMLKAREEVILKRNFELKVEHTRAELALVTSTRGGGRNPFIIPKIVKNILPEEIGNATYMWCCIKVQGSWVVIHDDIDSSMNHFANKSSKEIDFIPDNAILGKIASLPSFDNVVREMEPGHHVVLSRILPPYEISVLWSQGLGTGFTVDSSQYGRKEVVALSVSPTCVWLLWIDPLLLGNFDPLTSLIQYFSCVETASQLAIVVLSQYYEHQHQSADIVGGMTARDVSLALLPEDGGDQPILSDLERSVAAWRSLPRVLGKYLGDCTCEVFVIVDRDKRSHHFSVVVASDMGMFGLDYDDVGAIPSLVLSAAKLGTPIQCNDSDNPQRNRDVDLSGDTFTKAVIAAPIPREADASHRQQHQQQLYQCAVVFRFKHRSTSAYDMLKVNAIITNIAPIIHKFLDSTAMQVICPVSMLPHSRALQREQPGHGHDSDEFDSDLDEHEEHPARAVGRCAMTSFGLVQDLGLAGLMSRDEIRAAADTLDSSWAIGFFFETVSAEGMPEECRFVNNVGDTRSLLLSSLNKRLHRMLAKSYKKAMSREQHAEKVNGVGFKSLGVLELLNVDEEYEHFAIAMPDHISNLQCMSVLGHHSDDSVSMLVLIAGRHWRPISFGEILPRARSLQAIVDSAIECKEMKGLYEVEKRLEETIDRTLEKVNHGKQVTAKLSEFQASLDELSRDEARGAVRGSLRQALLMLLDSFVQEFFLVKFPYVDADSIGVSNALVAQEAAFTEIPARRFQYDRETDEWIPQAESLAAEAFSSSLDVFNDRHFFADIECADSGESFFRITWGSVFFENGEILPSTTVVFDETTIDMLHNQLQTFFEKHQTTMFGTGRESQAMSHFANGRTADSEEEKLDSIFLELGYTNAQSMLEQGRSPCSYASDDAFVGALCMLEPQFIVLPVRLAGAADGSGGDRVSGKEPQAATVVHSQGGKEQPHPSFPAVPPRIADQLLSQFRLHTEGQAAAGSSLTRLDSTGSLYNFVLDSGLYNDRIHKNCISFVYSRGFTQHNALDCVQYLILSFWDVLIAPSHVKDLWRHLDFALLPLSINATFRPLFLAAAAVEAIARSSIETVVKVSNEPPSQVDSGAMVRGRAVEIKALDVNGDVGFIEESLRAVEAAVPADSSSALAVLSSCDKALSQLLVHGTALLGAACICSASFLISGDDMRELLGEQGDRSGSGSDYGFGAGRELVVMQSNDYVLPSSSRIVVGSGSGDEMEGCSGAALEVFDARDMGKVIKGGLPALPAAFLLGQGRVAMLSIKVSDKVFGAGADGTSSSSSLSSSSYSGADSGTLVTIGAALFWLGDTANKAEKANLFSKESNYSLHASISGTLLLLARMVACSAGALLAVSAGELRGSVRLRSVLVDEVAHSIAYKTAMACVGAVLSGQCDSSSSGSASEGLRRLGYIDSLSGEVLDGLQEQLRATSRKEEYLQSRVDAVSGERAVLEEAVGGLRKHLDQLLQFISAVNDVCFMDTGEAFHHGTERASFQTLLFTVSINQQILRHVVEMICSNNLYEEFTFQLRLIACALLSHSSDHSFDEWDALTWTQRAKMLGDCCHSGKEELSRDGGRLLDDHLVVAWCLPGQRCDVSSVKGVQSWDMLREALRSSKTVIVEATNDKHKHSIQKYVPVVSGGVCAAVLQFNFDQLRISKFDAVVQSSMDFFFAQMSACMLKRSSAISSQPLGRSKQCSLVDAIEGMVVHEQMSRGEDLSSTGWLSSEDFEADVSSLIARLLGADGCFLVPVRGHEDGQYEGQLCRWEGGVVRRDAARFVSLERESIAHLLSGPLDAPQHLLQPSALGHSTITLHVLTLPVQLEAEGERRGLLVAESLLRPTLEMEVRLLAVSRILALLLSRRLSQSSHVRAASVISDLNSSVADANKVIAEKTFSATILHCHTIPELETAIETSLHAHMGLAGSALLRVHHEDVLAHGEALRASMAGIELFTAAATAVSDSAQSRPEHLAAQSLVSSTVVYHLPRGEREWSAFAYVPVAYVSGTSKGDESGVCSWVLQCRFDRASALEAFRSAGHGERVALSAARDLRQWLKTFRHKQDTELRGRSLQLIREVCQQVAAALGEVRAVQADGAIKDWDSLAAALSHAFSGRGGGPVESARLYWANLSGDQGKGGALLWETCDVQPSGAFTDTEAVNSMLTLRAYLRVGTWSVVKARGDERAFQRVLGDLCVTGRYEEVMGQGTPSPSRAASASKQLIQLELTEGAGFDSVWLSVGAGSERPAVLELRLAPRAADALDSDELAAAFGLLREATCHTIGGLLRAREESLSATASECESRLGLAQLSTLSRCLGELCAESTFSRSVDDLCLSVQSVVAELPGVHSVWLQCVDTSSGGIMYEHLCTSPAVGTALSSWQQQTPVHRTKTSALDDSDLNSLSYGMTISTLNTASPMNITKGPRRDADGTARAIEPPSRPGIEFVLECVDVAGRLVMHHMSEDELRQSTAADRGLVGLKQGDEWDLSDLSHGLRDGVGEDDAEGSAKMVTCITSREYRHRERNVLQTLARALARRVYELHKGKQNLQVLSDKKSEAALHQRRVKETTDRMEQLESTKAALFLQYSQTLEECDGLRKRINEERDAAASTKTQHLQATAAYNDNVAELRRELARKDALLSQSIAAVQQERKLGEDKKTAVSKELERALVSEAEAEDARKKVYADLQAAETETRRKIRAYEGTIEAFRTELEMLKGLVENSDAKFHVLMTKLSSAEDELAKSRTTIATLRNDLATSTLALALCSTTSTEQVTTEVVVTEEVATTHETVVNEGIVRTEEIDDVHSERHHGKKASKTKKIMKK